SWQYRRNPEELLISDSLPSQAAAPRVDEERGGASEGPFCRGWIGVGRHRSRHTAGSSCQQQSCSTYHTLVARHCGVTAELGIGISRRGEAKCWAVRASTSGISSTRGMIRKTEISGEFI